MVLWQDRAKDGVEDNELFRLKKGDIRTLGQIYRDSDDGDMKRILHAEHLFSLLIIGHNHPFRSSTPYVLATHTFFEHSSPSHSFRALSDHKLEYMCFVVRTKISAFETCVTPISSHVV